MYLHVYQSVHIGIIDEGNSLTVELIYLILLKESYDAISSFAFSLECYEMFMYRQDPEVVKTKVSKPKRYSLSKLRLCHAPLKRLIQTHPYMSHSNTPHMSHSNTPHMSTSPCLFASGVVLVTAVVLMQPCQRDAVFLGEIKSTLFGLPKVNAFRNH